MEFAESLFPVLTQYQNEDHIEVEIRLGKHNGNVFDTNVGKDTWERVLSALKKYKDWECVSKSESDVFYNDANNIRISMDSDTGEQAMIQKISVVKKDFQAEPLDIRFCIAREIPTSGDYDMDRKRNKIRHSFVRKNLSIDMTMSSGDNIDMDSEEEYVYQIELEIKDPRDVKTLVEFKNIMHKITNLFETM